MRGQEVQHLQLLGGHFHGLSLIVYLILFQADRQPREGQGVLFTAGGGGTAQHSLDAGQQLLALKGLGHVVVRAQLQAQHLIKGFLLGGQHDDGNLRYLPHGAAYLPAVHARQHDIQNHQAGGILLEGGQRLIPAAINGRIVAILFQIQLYQLGDVGIVVHDHDQRFIFHGCLR